MRLTFLVKNLFHNRIRTLLTFLGISIPIIPIFLQFGLYSAMMQTAEIFYEQLEFDLAILSRNYLFFSKPSDFSINRVHQALGIVGVEESRLLKSGFHLWRNNETGDRREILILGIETENNPFRQQTLRHAGHLLRKPDSVMIDLFNRPEFGSKQIGTVTELGSTRVEIVGQYSMGTGFSALGAVVVNVETWDKVFHQKYKNRVNVGLLKLASAEDTENIRSSLQNILPADVEVVSRKELMTREHNYWSEATSLGAIIIVSLIVSFGVGVVMIYQILSTDISNRIVEYATLKAIGYQDRYLAIYLLQYVVGLCFLGFIPGYVISWILYELIWKVTRLPMEMTIERTAIVFVITLGMALCAGFFTLHKVNRADPAELFS